MCETTGRSIALAGGMTLGAPAFAPSTLDRTGATGAVFANDAIFTSLAGTVTAALDTGSEFVIVRVGTAVTAPFTVRFA